MEFELMMVAKKNEQREVFFMSQAAATGKLSISLKYLR